MNHEAAEDLVELFSEIVLLATDPRKDGDGQQRDDWNSAWDRCKSELTNVLFDAFGK
jgi:hypothetical protein